MNALRQLLPRWVEDGEPFAIATVVAVSGSAPRAPGACMLISQDGSRFSGSVSSGCLEAEVIEAAKLSIQTGETQKLKFGPDGQPPWQDGLTCGGWIDVRVEPWWTHSPHLETRKVGERALEWLTQAEPGVIVSRGNEHLAIDSEGRLIGNRVFDDRIVASAIEALGQEWPSFELPDETGSVFLRTLRPRPRLFIVGAVDIAISLVAMGTAANWNTVVVDPRRFFTREDRFPVKPEQLICSWPQPTIAETALGPRDAALVLTHDPKIDDAALLALLETRVGYIGALGSRHSHAARLERLSPLVSSESLLERIQGPAGLHLGSANPAGIAIGILAGVTQWQATDERYRAARVASLAVR